MKRNRKAALRDGIFYAHVLPSSLPGESLSGAGLRITQDGDAGYLVKSGKHIQYEDWRHVAVVSSSPLIETGLRCMLADMCPVRLRVFATGQSLVNACDEGMPLDLVFWLLTDDSDISRVLKCILSLRRKLPKIRQIVMGNRIPHGIFNIENIIGGVTIANNRGSIKQIRAITEKCLDQRLQATDFLPKKLLTKSQRRILALTAMGYSNQEISIMLSITPKTVSAHQLQAMNKLNIITHSDKAWILRTIHTLISETPLLKSRALRIENKFRKNDTPPK